MKETLDVALFWLDRGTDGFRCDVVGKLFESPEGCDMIPETIAYVEKLRAVLDATAGRVIFAEPSDFHDATKYFGNGSDRFHMTFDFGYGYFWVSHSAPATRRSSTTRSRRASAIRRPLNWRK